MRIHGVMTKREKQLGVRVTPEIKAKLLALQAQWEKERGPGREPSMTSVVLQLVSEGIERHLVAKR